MTKYVCTSSWWWVSTPQTCRAAYRNVINWIQSHLVGQLLNSNTSWNSSLILNFTVLISMYRYHYFMQNNQLKHTYIIHTILLALCYCNIFRPSSCLLNRILHLAHILLTLLLKWIILTAEMNQFYCSNESVLLLKWISLTVEMKQSYCWNESVLLLKWSSLTVEMKQSHCWNESVALLKWISFPVELISLNPWRWPFEVRNMPK